MTLAALVAPDDTPEELLARAASARLGELRERAAAAARPGADRALPGRERDAARALRGGRRARGRADPRRASWRRSCSRARCRCTRRAPHDPAAVLRRAARGVPVVLRLLRRARRRDARRRQPRAAGAPRGPARRARSRSPARRGAAPTPPSTTTSASSCCATRATARSTRSSRGGSSARCARTRCGWPPRPSPTLVRIANIQHLATPIRAQLAAPIDALELAGLMHPTPAVGGEPLDARRAADPRARGPRPRLVRGPGRLDRRDRRRRVLRRAALRAAARAGRALLRRQRHRARLRPGGASWPRPRSSCRRCCRCSPAERAATTALPHARGAARRSPRARCAPR